MVVIQENAPKAEESPPSAHSTGGGKVKQEEGKAKKKYNPGPRPSVQS